MRYAGNILGATKVLDSTLEQEFKIFDYSDANASEMSNQHVMLYQTNFCMLEP